MAKPKSRKSSTKLVVSKPVRKPASLAETTKQVNKIARQIKQTGKIKSVFSGKYIKATPTNLVRQVTAIKRETTGNARQISRTTRQATKLVKEIAKLFTTNKKTPAPTRVKKTAPSKPVRKSSSKTTATSTKKAAQRSNAKTKKAASTQRRITSTGGTKKPAPTKRRPKTPEPTRIYEVSELPEAFNNATLNATIEELRENADGYDSFLRPGDRWAMRIGYTNRNGNFVGGYSYESFPDFAKLMDKIETYRFAQEFGDDADAKDDLTDIIRLIRFKAPGKNTTDQQTKIAWRDKKKVEVSARKERHKQERKAKREREKLITAQKKQIAKLEKAAQEKEFELRMAHARLRQKETESGKASKKAAKKAAKKKTKKNQEGKSR